MAEKSPPQEVGSAMWGGRRPEDVGEPRTIGSPDAPTATRNWPDVMPLRPIISFTLVLIGLLLFSTGLGLLLGAGGALVGAGLVAIVIGLLLGMGGDAT